MNFNLRSVLPLVLASVASVGAAHATTITFGSYGGNSAPTGLSNSSISYNNTGAGAPSTTLLTGTVATYNTCYTNTLAGTTWVSYDPSTASVGDNGGNTTYTTSYTGNLASSTGSISLLADDSVAAYLNGTFLGSTVPASYDTLASFTIGSGIYKNGVNTFTFVVTNGPAGSSSTVAEGPTGFDFSATAATAVTPEPSTLLMLGTGVLSAAGMIRRRIVG